MIAQQKILGNLIGITVSDTGISHRLRGKPNEDSAIFHIEEEDFVMAISDGVGSCLDAAYGACAAVQAATHAFYDIRNETLEFNKDKVAKYIIEDWFMQISSKEPNQCCATLKVAIKKGAHVLLLSIGDGLLAITSAGFYMVAPTDEQEFSNQTKCLNSNIRATDFWGDYFLLDVRTPFVVFACTDGVANNIQQECKIALLEEIENNTSSNQLKDELVSFITEISDYSSDDRTVGVIKYEWKNAESHR